MRAETKRKLEDILSSHDRKFLSAGKQATGGVATVETFDQAFQHVCSDAILPAMRDVAEVLAEHKVHTEVMSNAERAILELHVQTDAEDHGFALAMPSLTFAPDRSTGKIRVHENALLPYLGGSSGVIADLGFDDVTVEAVEDLLVSLAEKVLRSGDVG